MQIYLEKSSFIDWDQSQVFQKAKELTLKCQNQKDIVRACFEFVRDQIKHSSDYGLNPVTIKASDVLKHQTGFCYAKSHLLAALLRANRVPTGLCYQRLTIKNNQPPFCLHGLNAVYLDNFGWYRMDARGNNKEVDAQFCPPVERLAYPIITPGECDLPEIWARPLPIVTQALKKSQNYHEAIKNLPDVEIWKQAINDSVI